MPPVEWRVTVNVGNASGVPVDGARLTLHISSGGQVQHSPQIVLSGATHTFLAPSDAQSIVCELRHLRYAPLHMALVRSPGETVWRWLNATRRVRTTGHDVEVLATLGRIRPVPVSHIPEAELFRRAAVHQPALEKFRETDAPRKARHLPLTQPDFVPLDPDFRTALVNRDRTAYRLQQVRQPAISEFLVARPELFSDAPAAEGWRRFATSKAAVDPQREGRFYLVEYGDVGDDAGGTRFAVGVWVPHRLHDPKAEKLDFVVWLHPSVTNNKRHYPQVHPPFRPPYPYGILATMGNGSAIATQRFIEIPITQVLEGRFLAYQLAAAHRSAVIVVPVAPSNHFEPFVAPATLMRLLKELCLWIPRDVPRGAEAAVHRPSPAVGRIVVSAFSSSVKQLHDLTKAGGLTGSLPDSLFDAPHWWAPPRPDGSANDVVEFDRAWKEQWAIDGFTPQFLDYADAAASWVQLGDRRLRIYKSRFTGGWNLPTPRRVGAWADLVKRLRLQPQVHRSGGLRAVSMSDKGSVVHAVSIPDEFVLGPETGPDAALKPTLKPDSAHEMMSLVFFGHAAVTSGLTIAP
ncbi:hypothetical protein [Streptomyces sp. I05A-00742]|uniref:hypothetical protein n=1 Tax=Streptomyces sp. I05A-00742 TaxID=2732853 RepID=UPI001487C92B|nr:hypothetical protein [Streptomyces sp. I05A-00742]